MKNTANPLLGLLLILLTTQSLLKQPPTTQTEEQAQQKQVFARIQSINLSQEAQKAEQEYQAILNFKDAD